MKKTASALLVVGIGVGVAAGLKAGAQDDRDHKFHFMRHSLVLSRSVYVGTADSVVIGETLPLGCVGGPNGSSNVVVPTTTPGQSVVVNVPCGVASDNGEAPNLNDNPNAWNNSGTDGSFGISSPIFLDNISDDGRLYDTLPIPDDQIVTSFSSKSELALNLSLDGESLTFIGYRRSGVRRWFRISDPAEPDRCLGFQYPGSLRPDKFSHHQPRFRIFSFISCAPRGAHLG